MLFGCIRLEKLALCVLTLVNGPKLLRNLHVYCRSMQVPMAVLPTLGPKGTYDIWSNLGNERLNVVPDTRKTLSRTLSMPAVVCVAVDTNKSIYEH